jgi:uncharacterized membrane protein YdfJ with MMPL/SSD domain
VSPCGPAAVLRRVDFLDRAYGAFPWLVLGVLALTSLLLMRAFRSILLPLKAVILNLLSVAAAYGALVVVFRLGVGEDAFGLYRFPHGDHGPLQLVAAGPARPPRPGATLPASGGLIRGVVERSAWPPRPV